MDEAAGGVTHTFSMALRKGRVLRRWYRSAKMYGLIRYAALSDSRNAWNGSMWRHPGPASRSLAHTTNLVSNLLSNAERLVHGVTTNLLKHLHLISNSLDS